MSTSTRELTPPQISVSAAESFAKHTYGIDARASRLPGYDSENFRLKAPAGVGFVLKVYAPDMQVVELDAQMAALGHLAGVSGVVGCPRPCMTCDERRVGHMLDPQGRARPTQMLTYVPGEPFARVARPEPALFRELGSFFARLDRALFDFTHPGARRESTWDLARAHHVASHTPAISVPARRRVVDYFYLQFELEALPILSHTRTGVIHGDGNEYNVMVSRDTNGAPSIAGVVDFGDLLHSHLVCELAIVSAYAMLGREDPVAAAALVVAGYHRELPLTQDELEILFWLICARLCVSVTHSSQRALTEPHNTHITISQAPAWALLDVLIRTNPLAVTRELRRACGMRARRHTAMPRDEICALRRRHVLASLRLLHDPPIEMTRGSLQYLHDADGRTYLDAYNNVPHVGHAHPRVVRSLIRQSARLNTNTRYHSAQLCDYARRLAATLPRPLEVCCFVASGSEANDLALRLARGHTGATDVVVVDGAYHGNTCSVLELSPYKFNGPGGAGQAAHVHVASMPDAYRGKYRGESAGIAARYADDVRARIEHIHAQGAQLAAFFCEALLGCSGQIVPPPGYLEAAYAHVRAAGGLCVADEVQIGFGRVGSHFWGFAAHGVVPDIVTLGKPIGSGHPIAAVVMTREVAQSLDDRGMELFSTYGGNTVSCAVGLTVLDVIEDEGLQANAQRVGARLLAGLRDLQARHEVIGDVRGMGLFLGVELVRSREGREPDATLATRVAEGMRAEGVLVGTDGPCNNVIKIKPPLVFSDDDADRLLAALNHVLSRVVQCSEPGGARHSAARP